MLPRLPFLVRFGYFGHRFRGLQPQPGFPTAGEALRVRLEEAGGERARSLNFAARTDTGVHALNNLATFNFKTLDLDVDALKSHVAAPRDDGLFRVRLLDATPHVHARGNARGKRYRYILDDQQDDADDPHHPHHVFQWRLAPTLDVERMRAAAMHIVGTKDFSSFRMGKSTGASAVKTLVKVRVRGPYPLDVGRRVVVEIVGDAFLRKMVRNIVGLLAEVGTGLRAPDDVKALIAAQTRHGMAITAPPGGLTLVDVGSTWPADGSALIAELRRFSADLPLSASGPEDL